VETPRCHGGETWHLRCGPRKLVNKSSPVGNTNRPPDAVGGFLFPGLLGLKQPTVNSFWAPAGNPLYAVLRNVKGRRRRKMIRDHHAAGKLDELFDELLKDCLDDRSRQSLDQIHLTLMGGEYLPDYRRRKSRLRASDLNRPRQMSSVFESAREDHGSTTGWSMSTKQSSVFRG
jgi:hypothetical protein